MLPRFVSLLTNPGHRERVVHDGQTDNLWLQNLDGSPGKQLIDFKIGFIRDFDCSHDGEQLEVIRGHLESDVVLIRDSEK